MNFIKQSNHKKRIPFHVYLTYLVIMSMVFTGVAFSKYVISSSVDDHARVVHYGELSFSNNKKNAMIIPGVNIEEKSKISFTGSETANYIFLKVSTGNQWMNVATNPYAFKTTQDDYLNWSVDRSLWTILKTDATESIYYTVVQPNTNLKDYNVVKNNLIYVSKQLTHSQIKKYDPSQMNIQFTAIAMQYNGEQSQMTDHQHALKSWNSINNMK